MTERDRIAAIGIKRAVVNRCVRRAVRTRRDAEVAANRYRRPVLAFAGAAGVEDGLNLGRKEGAVEDFYFVDEAVERKLQYGLSD